MDTVAEDSIVQEEEKAARARIDYKMVTFSLRGKDFGINIMKVKEISKESKFTFVPNTPAYVRGVHNLRGEIIPIIDLRKMFYLPVSEKRDNEEQEEVIILRLANDLIIGIIVDAIDRVLGVAYETIQPPHPIFGDINIKYIEGIIESNGRLYIILDVERIFSEEYTIYQQIDTEAKAHTEPLRIPEPEKEPTFNFVIETLKTFSSFHVSDLNRIWVEERFEEWEKRCKTEGRQTQLQGTEDAEEFLKSYYSPYTGMMWGSDYQENLMKLLPENPSGSVFIWNPGCGKGFETYSLAAIAKIKYPQHRIKVWANDIDLLSVSTAPNMILAKEEIPSYLLDTGLLKEQARGFSFIDSIRDSIVFEYHDILHHNEYPEADIIVARDVLSFFEPESQQRILSDFQQKLKDDGLLIVGKNETLPEEEWYLLREGNLIAYKKEKS